MDKVAVCLLLPIEADDPHRNTRKLIRDGHILIQRAGKTYTVTGQELNL